MNSSNAFNKGQSGYDTPKFGEWIKCSEQRPKVGSTVLYFPKHSEPIVVNIIERSFGVCYQIETGGNIIGSDWDYDFCPISDVDSWMPLPEAPNE